MRRLSIPRNSETFLSTSVQRMLGLWALRFDSTVKARRLHDSRRDAGATNSDSNAGLPPVEPGSGGTRANRPPDPQIGSTPDTFPAPTVSTADILKFLIDRTGYIKLLEGRRHARSFLPHRKPARTGQRRHGLARSRRNSRPIPGSCRAGRPTRDDYGRAAPQDTLMSLHAAKGLEFPLIFLSGLEEDFFHIRGTMLVPET